MDQATEREIRSALERLVPAPIARRAKLEALDGGINRRSYLVTVGAARWVLRIPASGMEPLLDVVTEANVTRIAADAQLAPAVRGFDAETGVLLTDFRVGARAWTPEDARRSGNIERIAALLRSLHSLDSRAPEFAAESIARSYLSALSVGVGARHAHSFSTAFGPRTAVRSQSSVTVRWIQPCGFCQSKRVTEPVARISLLASNSAENE